MKKFALLLQIIPNIKRWIFSDGKFQKDRAITLLVGFALLLLGVHFIDPMKIAIAMEFLDELSDILGYVPE